MKRLLLTLTLILALAGCGTQSASHVPESDDGIFLTAGQRCDYLMYGQVLDSKGQSHDCILIPGFATSYDKSLPLFKAGYEKGLKCYVSNGWYSTCFKMLGTSRDFSGQCFDRAINRHPADAVARFEESVEIFNRGTDDMVETFSDMGPSYVSCLKFTGDNFGRNLGGWLTPPVTLAGLAGVTALWPAWGLMQQTFCGIGSMAYLMLCLGNGGLSVAEFPLAGATVAGAHVLAPVRAVASPLLTAAFDASVGACYLGTAEAWNLALATPISFIEFRPQAAEQEQNPEKAEESQSPSLDALKSDQSLLLASSNLFCKALESKKIQDDYDESVARLGEKLESDLRNNESQRKELARPIVKKLFESESFKSFASTAERSEIREFFLGLLQEQGIGSCRQTMAENLMEALDQLQKEQAEAK